jgi:hypothetical protein
MLADETKPLNLVRCKILSLSVEQLGGVRKRKQRQIAGRYRSSFYQQALQCFDLRWIRGSFAANSANG